MNQFVSWSRLSETKVNSHGQLPSIKIANTMTRKQGTTTTSQSARCQQQEVEKQTKRLALNSRVNMPM
jgi:hypothetical protein